MSSVLHGIENLPLYNEDENYNIAIVKSSQVGLPIEQLDQILKWTNTCASNLFKKQVCIRSESRGLTVNELLNDVAWDLSRELQIEENKEFNHLMIFIANIVSIYEKYLVIDRKSKRMEKQEESEQYEYFVRVLINDPSACTKFHDDRVALRCCVTFDGEPTIALDSCNWNQKFWNDTEGMVTFPEDVTPEQSHQIIDEFNQNCVLKDGSEIHVNRGDLLFLKGGRATSKPAIHRAPYHTERQSRFFLSIDYIPSHQVGMLMMSDDDEEDMCDEGCSEC